MRFVLTGATGFVGQTLQTRLRERGHDYRVLSRSGSGSTIRWDPMREPAPADALDGADAVIHLAGETVSQRWTSEAKQRIRESRVMGTRHLVEGLRQASTRPAVLVSASAIGYYGSRGDEKLTEASGPGEGIVAELAVDWENEARKAEAFGMRVVRVRIGMVLGQGGALAKMLLPFKLGLGGRLSSGEQWMSWIHVRDLASMLIWAAETSSVSGALNGVAPGTVRNREFTKVLGGVLGRPTIFPVPAAAIRLLYGEMSKVVLASERVCPEVALQGGFEFEFRDLRSALSDVAAWRDQRE